MTYHWTNAVGYSRQHWLHTHLEAGKISIAHGLVYEVTPSEFDVYGEDYGRTPFSRVFLGTMPTLDEAKDMLLTITASQNI